MAEVLARLFHLTGDPNWRVRADAAVTAFAGQTDQFTGMPTLLAARDLLEEGASVVIVGDDAAALVEAAWRVPDPAVMVLWASDTGTLPADHPAHGRRRRHTTRPPTCVGGTCAACRSSM